MNIANVMRILGIRHVYSFLDRAKYIPCEGTASGCLDLCAETAGCANGRRRMSRRAEARRVQQTWEIWVYWQVTLPAVLPVIHFFLGGTATAQVGMAEVCTLVCSICIYEDILSLLNICITLWLFNIAMEHGPFIDDFPS